MLYATFCKYLHFESQTNTFQRGGAANIGSPGLPATKRSDNEIIPEHALRHSEDQDHHVGRGGAGNEEHVHKKPEVKTHVGLADKLKMKLLKKKAPES